MTAPAAQRPRRPTSRSGGRRTATTPVLVRQMRNGIEESVHRGDIVEADASGELIRVLGDPDRRRHASLDGQAVRGGRAHRGGRGRGVRSRAGRDRDPGQLAFRRGPARPHAPGHVPPGRRQPDAPGLRQRGDAARPPDRRTAGPRRREGRADPPHVLRPARGVAPPVPAQGLGTRGLLAIGPSLAGRLPVGRGPRLRHDTGPPGDGDRRVRDRDLRLPAPRGRARLRDAGRPGGPASATIHGSRSPRRSRSSATRCWPSPR